MLLKEGRPDGAIETVGKREGTSVGRLEGKTVVVGFSDKLGIIEGITLGSVLGAGLAVGGLVVAMSCRMGIEM